MAGELTRISCELLFATILHQRRYGEYAVYNYKLFFFLQLLRQLGDDEATEGGIVLLFGWQRGVRVDTEELRIGTRETLVGEFDVPVVLLLPKGKTLGVVHLRFAELDRLAEHVTLRLLLSCHFLRVTMQRVIANHRLTISMGSIELAVAR